MTERKSRREQGMTSGFTFLFNEEDGSPEEQYVGMMPDGWSHAQDYVEAARAFLYKAHHADDVYESEAHSLAEVVLMGFSDILLGVDTGSAHAVRHILATLKEHPIPDWSLKPDERSAWELAVNQVAREAVELFLEVEELTIVQWRTILSEDEVDGPHDALRLRFANNVIDEVPDGCTDEEWQEAVDRAEDEL